MRLTVREADALLTVLTLLGSTGDDHLLGILGDRSTVNAAFAGRDKLAAAKNHAIRSAEHRERRRREKVERECQLCVCGHTRGIHGFSDGCANYPTECECSEFLGIPESGPIFPHVNVNLVGEDGNAEFILARVQRAMRHGGIRRDMIEKFMGIAKSSDYDHLLRTVIQWVTTDPEGEED